MTFAHFEHNTSVKKSNIVPKELLPEYVLYDQFFVVIYNNALHLHPRMFNVESKRRAECHRMDPKGPSC